VADEILREIGVQASLIRGGRGVFTVAVDGLVVARKTHDGFPSPDACVEAVRDALQSRESR